MTFEKLTDEISIYLASKIPSLKTDIHTLKEIVEYLAYKTHNVGADMVMEDRKIVTEQISDIIKRHNEDIRQTNRMWEREIKRIDKNYDKRRSEKHAHWIIEEFEKTEKKFISCSECRSTIDCDITFIDENEYDYCPYCGAKMDEKSEENG